MINHCQTEFYKFQVQNNKQILSMQKHKVGNQTEQFKCVDNSAKINSKWTNEELLLAVQGWYIVISGV